MTVITAKELRDNLGEVSKRVSAGEHIYISYRNKLTMKLEPVLENDQAREPLAGLKAFLAAPKKPSLYDPRKSTKQIYHELLDEKYHDRQA